MNIVQRLSNMQLGLNIRGMPSRPGPGYLPSSSFEALNVSQNYRFYDSNDTNMSPIMSIGHRENRVAVANDIGDMVLLDRQNLSELVNFRAHRGAIFDLKWRPDHANHMLSGSGDRCIMLWDVEKAKSTWNIFPAHNGSVKALSFQDSNVFISGGRDCAIKLWDIRTTGALKYGAIFTITDAHLSQLSTAKSPRSFKSARSRRQSPIALAAESLRYQPSNVVTSVQFHPTDTNYFYSSGIADNSIKVWDIRSCRKQHNCGVQPTPVKVHTIKHCQSVSTDKHGYFSLTFNDSPLGPVLYASCTNNQIFAFTKSSVYPVMAFSGRISDHFTKISSFGEDYLLSGSTTGRVYIWNSTLKLPSVDAEKNRITIENRYPIYQLEFDDSEEVSVVSGDYLHQNIYCCSDLQNLLQWNFHGTERSRSPESDQINQLPMMPECKPYQRLEQTPNTSIDICLNRSAPFEAMSCTKMSRPLTSITNFFQISESAPKRLKGDDSSQSSQSTPSSQLNENRAMSTGACKSQKRGIKRKRNSRRSLFVSNRKISDFFSTP